MANRLVLSISLEKLICRETVFGRNTGNPYVLFKDAEKKVWLKKMINALGQCAIQLTDCTIRRESVVGKNVKNRIRNHNKNL